MNITATTTDEQIMSAVAYHKQTLLDFMTEQVGQTGMMNGERMVTLAQNVASSEAVAQVSFQYRDLQAREPGDQTRIEFLFRVLARGSDDGWSGRQNDSRRSSHDAILAWARDQFDAIRFS